MGPVRAQPTPQPQALTLRQTVDLALASHLKTKLAHERIRESEARLQESWSALNPQLHLNAGQYNRSINLAAQGLSGPNVPIPAFIGPFYSFDSRVQLLYNFLDSARRWNVREAEVTRLIREQEEVLARRQVGVLASLAYIQLISAQQGVEAGLADLNVSQRMVDLALHQKEVGVAAGIDVTRAQTQHMEQLLRQKALEERLQRARLELARLTGLPLGSSLQAGDPQLPSLPAELTADHAIQRALDNRVELQLARLSEEQLASRISAEEASNSPQVGLVADYGLTGNTPASNVYGTHNVGLLLQLPLYDGGLSEARQKALESQLQQAHLQREDQQLQVEQEVRTAFLKLELARRQLETSQATRLLAEKEVTMSTDRFRHGLTDSLEVVTAQAALVRAKDAQIQAGVNYQLALVELAASMGQPEMILQGGIR